MMPTKENLIKPLIELILLNKPLFLILLSNTVKHPIEAVFINEVMTTLDVL